MPGMCDIAGVVGEGGVGEGVVGASFIGIFMSFMETQQSFDWLAGAAAFIAEQQPEWAGKSR